MPRCRFVDPTREVRLPLSGGDWIVIRYELNVGQIRDMSQALRGKDGTSDLSNYPIVRVLTWLKAWSFVDFNGMVAPISAGAFELFEPQALTEITAAIDAHEAAVLEEKKRMMTAVPDSDPILQSVG